jgi:hypothetical protein
MRNETQFTLMAPSTGFTSRVMARLAEHERAQARQRAVIGSVLLVGAAIAMIVLAALRLISAAEVFIDTPSVLVAVINAFASLAFWGAKFFESLWTVAFLIAQDVGAVEMLALAVAVIGLTAVWVRVVVGPFQLSSQTILVGGRK